MPFSFVISLVRTTRSWDRRGRRAKGCLQRAATARTADRKRTVHILAMISTGRTRVMNKQKKKVRRSGEHRTGTVGKRRRGGAANTGLVGAGSAGEKRQRGGGRCGTSRVAGCEGRGGSRTTVAGISVISAEVHNDRRWFLFFFLSHIWEGQGNICTYSIASPTCVDARYIST